MLLDGSTLILVVDPGILLAGPITVVGKFALATAMEFLVPFEACVADKVGEAEKKEMES